MKLQTLHETLYYGELMNLIPDVGVFPGALPSPLGIRVNALLKQGLTRLYSRFRLLEKSLTIQANDAITLYYLQTKFAVSDATVVPVKYIIDTVDDPFIGDILMIQQVFDELGREIPLNRPQVEDTRLGMDAYDPVNDMDPVREKMPIFYTPKYDCLQIPTPVTGAIYSVGYQANHPAVDADDPTFELMVPDSLEMALRAYIAGQVYGAMNGDNRLLGRDYMATFEAECQAVEQKDLLRNSDPDQGSKFSDRGFV